MIFIYFASLLSMSYADQCPPSIKDHVQKLTTHFGEHCHYQSDNEKLKPATADRVVFMGDSITEDWINKDPHLFAGDRIDRGISGQTTAQMLVRFKADVLDLKPRVLHLLAGTNDIAENTGPTTLKQIEDNIEMMATLAKAHGIEVILGSVLPTKKYEWAPQVEPAAKIQALNHWIKEYCLREKLVFVDYHSALVDADGGFQKALSKDGVHPNVKGYQTMRPRLEKALAETFTHL